MKYRKAFLLTWFVLVAYSPTNAQQPELILQSGPAEPVYSVAFSFDGKLLATASRTVKLWEVATGRQLRVFERSQSAIVSVKFSPTQMLVAGGSIDGRIILWDAASGRQLRIFDGHSDKSAQERNTTDLKVGISEIAFSPDGKSIVSAGADETIRMWEVSSGREIWVMEEKRKSTIKLPYWETEYSAGVVSVAFSPDGSTVAEGGRSLLSLRTAASGRRIRDLIDPVASLASGVSATESSASEKSNPAPSSAESFGIEGLVLSLVSSVCFSPDGKFVISGETNGIIRIWDIKNGREILKFRGDTDAIRSVSISPDGRLIAIGSRSGAFKIWDLATGKVRNTYTDHQSEATAVTFSPDGKLCATATRSTTVKVWETETGREHVVFATQNPFTLVTALSSDGKIAASGLGDGTIRFWDPLTGRSLKSFDGRSKNGAPQRVSKGGPEIWQDDRFIVNGKEIDPPAFIVSDATGRVIASANYHDHSIKLWEAASGNLLQTINVRPTSVVLSPDGKIVAISIYSGNKESRQGEIELWDVLTGRKLQNFKKVSSLITSLSFSPDGARLVTGSEDGKVRIWSTINEEPLFTLSGHSATVQSTVFSPAGDVIASGGADGTIRLWDATAGKALHVIQAGGTVSAVEFSKDGRLIAAGNSDGSIRIFEAATGRKTSSLNGQNLPVAGLRFLPSGDKLICSLSATTNYWDLKTEKQLASAMHTSDGWVVHMPEGRFDASDLTTIEGLHWVLPNDPYRALPLELFFREYYEPRLLQRLLGSEQFPPLPELPKLNRSLPLVRIAEVNPEISEPNNPIDTFSVVVRVANTQGEKDTSGKGTVVSSGVHDLRLFRDGQLVRYALEEGLPATLKSDGARITFNHVRVPRRADLKQVEFSAYAFNSDQIKSLTSRKKHEISIPLQTVKGRAYIITIGINAYENPLFDLKFASNDARRLQSVLTEKLKATGEYEDVVPITLLSDYELNGAERTITVQEATKSNIKLVFDALAGKTRLDGIQNANRIRPARPEDLIIISFASHGYADENGQFYFVTYDTGVSAKREVTAELLHKSISSDELSLWLRDIDAGEIVMIVDACQSAAAIEGEGFKPGPMGSRGLGQLAFDKGMRILAATQADNVALEHKLIQQGMLTYALVHDGIELGRADFKPEDKSITLAEWLAYGVERVPQLFAEVQSGQIRSPQPGIEEQTKVIVTSEAAAVSSGPSQAARFLVQGKAIGKSSERTIAEEQVQRPALFDFSRRRRDIRLLNK